MESGIATQCKCLTGRPFQAQLIPARNRAKAVRLLSGFDSASLPSLTLRIWKPQVDGLELLA
jgi:hypothetical protein